MPVAGKPVGQNSKRPKKQSEPNRVHDFVNGQSVTVVNAKGTHGPFKVESCQPQSYLIRLETYGMCHVENIRASEKEAVGKPLIEVLGEEKLVDFPPPGYPPPEDPAEVSDTTFPSENKPQEGKEEAPAPKLGEILGGVNLSDACGVRWKSACGNYSVIHLLKDKESADYFCTRIAEGMYEVQKLNIEEQSLYFVHIPVGQQKFRNCWCKGWRINKECRHVKALEKLLEVGRIS